MAGDRGSGRHGRGLQGLPLIPLFVAMIGAFMGILDGSIVNVAIPHIMNEFGAPTDDVQWVVTVYMLAMGVVVPFSGWLSDRFGSKRIYIFTLAAFTLGSVLCAFAWSVASLTAFRAVQAIGGGLLQPVVMAMVLRMVPRDRMGAAMGVIGLAMLLAPALGPTIGGYLVEYLSWRWIFLINLPIGIAAILGAMAVLPDIRGPRPKRVDWFGGLLAAAGLFALLFALSKGQSWGWRSEPIVLLFYASFVLLAAFVWWELRHPEPILPLGVLRHGAFSVSLLLGFVITVGLFSGLFYVPLFLQDIRGLSPLTTGLIMMPPALASGLMMPFAGALYDRVGPRPLIVTGIGLITYATWLLHHLSTDTPTRVIVGWMVVRGIGMGLTMMPAMTAGMSVVPEREVNAGSAIQNVIQRVGGSFGIAALTSVLLERQAQYFEAYRAAVTPDSPALQGFLQAMAGAAGGAAGAASTVGAASAAAGSGQALAQLVPQLYGLVLQRATVSAMDDLFVITAVITALAILPALALRARYGRGAARAGGFVGAE
ncbi:MAG: multidrug efflux MFS transporter [Clostridia bacterium]|nr:multidrug efflux MFS transporter [Clostridia bacterium]